MSNFNSTLQSVPCQSKTTQEARQHRHVYRYHSQKGLGSLCAELRRSVLCITELILKSDSDVHSLED